MPFSLQCHLRCRKTVSSLSPRDSLARLSWLCSTARAAIFSSVIYCAYDLVDVHALSLPHLLCSLFSLLSSADSDKALTSIAELFTNKSEQYTVFNEKTKIGVHEKYMQQIANSALIKHRINLFMRSLQYNDWLFNVHVYAVAYG